MTRALITTAIGLLLCAWVAFGRIAFGVQGELTVVYALAVIVPAALYLATGHAWRRAVRAGHRIRGATLAFLIASWACALLLGLMIPDLTPHGFATILSGTAEPALGIAIGISNPLAVIMIATAAFALALSVQDSRGGPRDHAEHYEEPAPHPLRGHTP